MRLLAALTIAFLLSACAGYPSKNDDAGNLYRAEVAQIYQQRDKGVFSHSAADKEVLSITKAYFPGNAHMAAMVESLIEYSKAYENGEITYDQMQARRVDRINRYNQGFFDRQREADDQSKRARTGAILNTISDTLRRSPQQPEINCSSTTVGGVTNTNCR